MREENESKKWSQRFQICKTNRRVITRKRNQFWGDKTVGFYTFKGKCVSSWNCRTRALVEMSNPRGKFHICHPRSDGWVLQGTSTQWEARALRTVWGKLWFGEWLGRGVRAVVFERKKSQLCSCQDRIKRSDQELQMLPNLKRMMFEMNAFACKIIRGDSSLSESRTILEIGL